MKIIIILEKKGGKKRRLMLEVLNKNTIREIKMMLKTLKTPKASCCIMSRSMKGMFVKEISEEDMLKARCDLVLTNNNAYWNLI